MSMPEPICRLCGAVALQPLIDFGAAPDACLLPGYLADRADQAQAALAFSVCPACWLIQSHSTAPARAAAAFAQRPDEAEMIGLRAFAVRMADRLPLNGRSQVVCLGAQAAEIAPSLTVIGVPVERLAAQGAPEIGRRADLICLGDGLITASDPQAMLLWVSDRLGPDGVAVFDAPSLPELLEDVRLDWLQHGQTNLPSMALIERILTGSGLRLFDAEILAGREGWLRYHVCQDGARWPRAKVLNALAASEEEAALTLAETYEDFGERAASVRAGLIDFLHSAHYGRKTVAAYGAGPEAIRLMGFLGTEAREIAYVVDPNLARRGKAVPGSGVGSFDPEELRHRRPDFVLILQGDARELIRHELAHLRTQGTRFVTALPHVSVIV